MDKTCIIWCTGWWPVHHPTSALRQTTSRWQHYSMRPPPISLLAQKAGDIHEASSRHLLHATACDIHVECARRSRAKVDAPLPKRPPNQEQDPLEGCETLQMCGRDAVGAATARAHEGHAGSGQRRGLVAYFAHLFSLPLSKRFGHHSSGVHGLTGKPKKRRLTVRYPRMETCATTMSLVTLDTLALVLLNWLELQTKAWKQRHGKV